MFLQQNSFMPRTSVLSYLRFEHTHTHTDAHICANTDLVCVIVTVQVQRGG